MLVCVLPRFVFMRCRCRIVPRNMHAHGRSATSPWRHRDMAADTARELCLRIIQRTGPSHRERPGAAECQELLPPSAARSGARLSFRLFRCSPRRRSADAWPGSLPAPGPLSSRRMDHDLSRAAVQSRRVMGCVSARRRWGRAVLRHPYRQGFRLRRTIHPMARHGRWGAGPGWPTGGCSESRGRREGK